MRSSVADTKGGNLSSPALPNRTSPCLGPAERQHCFVSVVARCFAKAMASHLQSGLQTSQSHCYGSEQLMSPALLVHLGTSWTSGSCASPCLPVVRSILALLPSSSLIWFVLLSATCLFRCSPGRSGIVLPSAGSSASDRHYVWPSTSMLGCKFWACIFKKFESIPLLKVTGGPPVPCHTRSCHLKQTLGRLLLRCLFIAGVGALFVLLLSIFYSLYMFIGNIFFPL